MDENWTPQTFFQVDSSASSFYKVDMTNILSIRLTNSMISLYSKGRGRFQTSFLRIVLLFHPQPVSRVLSSFPREPQILKRFAPCAEAKHKSYLHKNGASSARVTGKEQRRSREGFLVLTLNN